MTERQKDKKTERQKDKKTKRQKDKRTKRQKDRKTARQKVKKTKQKEQYEMSTSHYRTQSHTNNLFIAKPKMHNF
jgi:hypothetical protein